MFSDLSRRCALCISVTCCVLFTPVSCGTIIQSDDDDRLYRWIPFLWQTDASTKHWDDHDYFKYQSSTTSTSFIFFIVLIPICIVLVVICFIKWCRIVCTPEECLCFFCEDYTIYSEDRSTDLSQPTVDPTRQPSLLSMQQPVTSNPYRLSARNTPISLNNVREDLSRALSNSPHLNEEISSRSILSHSGLPREVEDTGMPEFRTSFSNIREDLFRTASDSAYLNEDISSRTTVYSSPPRTRRVEVPSSDRPPEYSSVEISSRSVLSHSGLPREVEDPNMPEFRTSFSNMREDIHRTMSDSAYLNEDISSRTDVHSSPPRTRRAEVPSSDSPPEYSSVVLSNLTEQVNFPYNRPLEEQETPPPKYDENILPKF